MSQYRHRRTSSAGAAFSPLEPGEIAVNTADRQLAVGDVDLASVGVPELLIAVRFFDVRSKYAVGDYMVQGGFLYRCKATAGPAAFDPTRFEKMTGEDLVILATSIANAPAGTISATNIQAAINELDTEKLALTGGTLTGQLTLPTGAANADAVRKDYVDGLIGSLGGDVTGKVDITGDTMTGPLSLPATPAPVAANAVRKDYVDAADTAVASALPGKLDKTGGTVTGDLIVSKADPALILDKPVAGTRAQIRGRTNGVDRWQIVLGGATLEGGGNAGSDFQLNSYDDAGAMLATPLAIARATGLASVIADPQTDNGVANKHYVDTAIAASGNIPAGAVMLFYNATAPIGWTKLTTQNDKALRVVSGAGGVAGGTNAFSSVFGVTATGATTLTTAQIPAHAHQAACPIDNTPEGNPPPTTRTNGFVGFINGPYTNIAYVNTELAGGGGSHTHPLTLNVSYIDLILAQKL